MTTQTKPTNRPLHTIRDGALKATIWKNTSENGEFYSVQISRGYQDQQGNWHDSDRFSGSELLRVSRLAQIAYDEILIARGQHPVPEANVEA